MNKLQAKQALLEGKKIRHTYFTEGEFIYEKNGQIFDESGCELRNFWQYRTNNAWDNGYSIVE